MGRSRRDWLVVDDESGILRRASECVKDYRGNIVSRRYADAPHPQDFIQAYEDTSEVDFLRPPSPHDQPSNTIPQYIGETDVPTSTYNAAAHKFQPGGIGEMQVGSSFIVR